MPRLKVLILFIAVLLVFPRPALAATLTINLIAVNASESEAKDIDVKYHLPKELEPDQVVDTGPLQLDYDVDKGSYFVYGTFNFQPKESRTFQVKVEDIWVITEDEITLLKNQVDSNLKLLENKPAYPQAKQSRDKAVQELDFILAQQQSYSSNIERRIEEYRSYQSRMKEIRTNIFSLDFLQRETRETEEEVNRTITLNIEVQNPSAKEEKKVQEKHYLPQEIRPENIVDAQGFDVRFDEKKNLPFLTKEETFKPGEVKKYKILLKDVWRIPLSRADDVQKRGAEAFDELKGTVYENSAQFLLDEINHKLEDVKESQDQPKPIQQHIGIFRVNTKRYDKARDNLEKMEQMMAIIRAKKLEEMESGKVKNVLSKLRALRGLAALSQALFQKRLTLTIVWRIIFITLGFVAFFTAIHFFIWVRRSAVMGEEKIKPGEGIKEVPKPGATA